MVKRTNLKTTLNVHMSQRLAMTPSLLQKIELLALSRIELSELITQELTENPVLEEAAETENTDGNQEKEKEKKEDSEYEDFDYEYFFGEYLNSGYQRREWESNDDKPSFEMFLANPSSLADHVNWQLSLCEISRELYQIAYFIVGNIDQDGYLTSSVEEMAENLGLPLEQVEEALTLVQTLDPLGVGARDLRECLLLQLRAAGWENTLVENLVRDCLPQIQAKKFKEIARQLDCDLEAVSEALDEIRHFSPRPGQKYSSDEPVYIQPDVYISKVGDDYQIVMNDDGLPKLRLNRSYRQLLKENEVSKDTKSFIKERFRSAMELLKSIDQREQTIYRVCDAIIKRQSNFLDRGLIHLKPMLIKDLAEELGVHSSTISRVVANKYAHTPQGIMELRKFFTVGVENSDGENISIVYVKQKIKDIIEDENPQKPLSDQKICKFLNRDGIQITRRTVAKYRDQMNIAGSRERKMAFMF
ncbi:MAG: RNA polymerase factor sigma-54 [Acidobacteriota bacterium]